MLMAPPARPEDVRALLSLLLVPVLLAAGCAAPGARLDADDSSRARLARPGPAFLAPVVLTSEGGGFEPSIDVAPEGTVYAAAAKSSRPNDGARLASWTWYSKDGGATFQDLPSPAGAHRLLFGFEGDTAVDAKGRFYFADTYLPDNVLHRWSPGADGPTWDWSRPLQGTTAPLDDRPFLSAHGDGVVYLLSNNGPAVPSLGGLLGGDATSARIHLFASTNGGLTWSLGHAFPDSRFCQIAASPADDQTAYVACDEAEGEGAPMRVWKSEDRGATWADAFLAEHAIGTGYLAPNVAVDAAGTPYAVWQDERVDWIGLQDNAWSGDEPGRLHVARPGPSGAWTTLDVTPFEGRYGVLHACAGPPGRLALTFYATPTPTVDDATEWRAYALLTDDAHAHRPTWRLSQMVDEPMSIGPHPPRDIAQCAVGPDGAVHAVVQRDVQDPDRRPGDGIHADVLYVRTPFGRPPGPG